MKKDSVFRFNYIHLRVGVATTRGAHREAQAPAPCTYYVSAEYRLPVESYIYDEHPSPHIFTD